MAFQDVVDQINEFDVNDIDWTRMGVWPVAGKAVLCALLVVAVCVGGYYLFVQDLNVQLDSVTQEEEKLRSSFKTKAFQASNLEAYRQQMIEMEESFGALISQLPSKTEVPGLLEDIDEKGTSSGLNISSISLQKEKKAAFYVELPISIKVSGSYHDFGSFVSGIAGMPRIVTLHDYQVKKGNSGLLEMTILAKTYRYKKKGK